MPTATEFFGYSAHNLGPLTTTYTAPSSCATGTEHRVFVNASDPVRFFAAPTCGRQTFGDCLPSGSSWDSIKQQTTEFVQGVNFYFSPGIACPSGWRTVGTLAHDDDDKVSAFGALATPKWDDLEGAVNLLHPTEFWYGLLEPSETLALCCPSNYKADAYGDCISTIGPTESFNYTAMCMTYRELNGVPISTWDGTTLDRNQLISIASGTDEPRTTVDDIWLTNTQLDWAVATYVPAVPLIYKKSDKDGKDGDDDDDDDDDNDDGDDSAASTTTSRQEFVSVLGLTLGLLAGAGMLL
ncbi:hypothetical protein FLONG3_7148 [Fusarium longipes]|uniref:Uncharacterized protein n=1 Tax=Fusarium longipes TaxID=694270 RepID=A0A395SFW9_9HYPO|nr:hypothetical protein FLONG3_7148 [Fusarium longipes]